MLNVLSFILFYHVLWAFSHSRAITQNLTFQVELMLSVLIDSWRCFNEIETKSKYARFRACQRKWLRQPSPVTCGNSNGDRQHPSIHHPLQYKTKQWRTVRFSFPIGILWSVVHIVILFFRFFHARDCLKTMCDACQKTVTFSAVMKTQTHARERTEGEEPIKCARVG